MKKRILPILLSLALSASLLPAAHAAQVTTADMAQVLAALDIMTGNEEGDLMLSRQVTRAEFTKLVIAASPRGKNVGATTTVSPYPDVPYTHWAAPYVEAAVAAGYVNGNVYGYFEPDRSITLQEGVTMAVRLLGYSDSDFSGAWPAGQMALYYKEDLDEGITIGQTSAMTRQDAMYLFYNLLTAATKAGTPYLTSLGYPLTAAGEIDRVGLINAAMNGPVVMEGDWRGKINFDVDTATVYRGGSLATLAALQPNDVIYYSASMRTLWAYSNKVTGLYQAVSPSAASPQAVTVAGKTYSIETAEAAYALSNLGAYKTGDTVTLLLGRDGQVAAVASSAAGSGTLYGVVQAVTDAAYTDQSGNSYTAKTALIAATDGQTYSYPLDAGSSLKAGNLVQVAVADRGDAKVSRLSGSSISGKVNAAGTQIGSTKFAEDVEILDTDGTGAAVKLYPSRLAGMSLESGDVRYCRKNANGEVDVLILDDATGDLYAYGVLTEVTETVVPVPGSLSTFYGAYQYDIGGQTYGFVKENGILNLSKGPVQIKGSLASPEKMTTLRSARLTGADASVATFSNGDTFPMWDQAAVYVLENNTYRLSSLDRVRTGHSLTGYYDKAAIEGGRIRVIVAKPI